MDFVGFDKLSLLDYEEKTACVLFSKHCNFRCPFCHNGLTVLESEDFTSWEIIKTYLNKRKGLIDAVVVSGGEPTLLDDLYEKVKEIKEMGYLVKLDTNGTNPEMLKKLVNDGLIDYVAMDIKNSKARYKETVGVDKINFENIEESIKFLCKTPVNYEFRTTLVNEFHDLESIKEMGELIKGSKKLYLQKFVEREGCIKKGLHEVPKEVAEEFVKILSTFVEEVKLRGY